MLNWLKFRTKRQTREATVRAMIAALDSQNYSQLSQLVDDDLTFTDMLGDRIEGRESFISFDRQFRSAAGDIRIVVASIRSIGSEVVVRGHITGSIRDIGAPTIWRARFHDRKVSEIEVIREGNQRTLPSFAKSVSDRQRASANASDKA